MEIFINIILFTLGAVFKEIALKPILKILYRKSLNLLPELFDKLDPVMPESIAKLSPEELSALIRTKIEEVAGEQRISLSPKEKEALFQEFRAKYDPVVASSKVTG